MGEVSEDAQITPQERDRTLMSGVVAADPTAQRTLVLRLAARVARIARGLLRSAADADDAAQNSLIAILHAAGTYRGESSIERWADRITVRTTLQAARDRRRREAKVAPIASPDDLPGPLRGASLSEGTARPIEAYLDALSSELREVLVLRHVLDCSIEEISELTGVSPNTVKDRLLRAREQVRRLIRRDLVAPNERRPA